MFTDNSVGQLHEIQLAFDQSSWEYKEDLERAEHLYPNSEVLAAMKENFSKMQDKTIGNADIITETSLKDGFESVFGFKCDYLAGRLYAILSGPDQQDITIPLFLQTFKKVIHGDFPERLQFGFRLYNASEDGNIKSVEVSDMMESLPQKGAMYDQCIELGDAFVSILTESFKTPVFEPKRFNMCFRDCEISKTIANGLSTIKPKEGFTITTAIKDMVGRNIK